MKKILLSGMLVAGGFIHTSLLAQSLPQLTQNNIDEVITALTLEEKAHLCIGYYTDSTTGQIAGAVMKDFVPGAAGSTVSVPRLGIPNVILADGPAGLRISPTRDFDSKTYYCTHFPIATALASTWNTELVRNVGKTMGEEVREYGVDVLLAPGMNIQRNPLCGRNYEYYSEDPMVTGKIAAAFVNGVQHNQVGTSIKHFVANNQETMRFTNDARISQRALREIYLKGFEIAVKESKPWTVMTSYNLLNGTYAAESKELMTTALRDEWGFDGVVVTDWYAGRDVAAMIDAGTDLMEPGQKIQYDSLIEAIKSGKLSEASLDRSAKRILQLIVKSPSFKKYNYSDAPDLKAHVAIARAAAAEAMVLLKNNDALPLQSSVNKVAVYGSISYAIIAGGFGSGNVNRPYSVSLIEGLRNNNYTVDKNILERYQTHIGANKQEVSSSAGLTFVPDVLPSEMIPTSEQLAKESADNDVALITFGRSSGENIDRSLDDFNLSTDEIAIINAVTEAFHKQGEKVVVILNVGGVMETESWKNKPDAILCAWQLGQEGGNGIADILSGAQYPSGKLPMTFPIKATDHYSSNNFPFEGRDDAFKYLRAMPRTDNIKNEDYTNYEEDIYVGYRYFDSFDKAVSYPFGYGLSYTTFEYSNPIVNADANQVTISVCITNTGKRSGKEIAEVYVTAPKGKLNKPAQELKAFAKTKELRPGESDVLTMTLPLVDLASFDEASSMWIVDKGKYLFNIGASSRNIKSTTILPLKGMKQKVSNSLKLNTKLNRLH